MKTPNKIMILFVILIISLVGLTANYFGGKREPKIKATIQIALEKAYFEGQRDSLEGDIRIGKVKGHYVWTSSPWNSGKKPIFHP